MGAMPKKTKPCVAKGCKKVGIKRCARCRTARYCSMECHVRDWKAGHGKVCRERPPSSKRKSASKGQGATSSKSGKDEVNSGNGIIIKDGLKEAMESMAGTPTFHGATGNTVGAMPNLLAPWYEGLPRERVYQRLIVSFCLRVEDEYSLEGELYGAYDARAGGEELAYGDLETSAISQFRAYVDQARMKGMLPPDFSFEDKIKLEHMAAARGGVYDAWEKSDVQAEFGNFEPMILRMMAEKILGCPIGGEWPDKMFDDDSDEYETYDEAEDSEVNYDHIDGEDVD